MVAVELGQFFLNLNERKWKDMKWKERKWQEMKGKEMKEKDILKEMKG